MPRHDWLGVVRAVGILQLLIIGTMGWTAPRVYSQDVAFPLPSDAHPIEISAAQTVRWEQGAYEVFHLRGEVAISQDWFRVESQDAVVLRELSRDENDRQKILIYAEGQVVVNMSAAQVNAEGVVENNRMVDEAWIGRLFTTNQLKLPNSIGDIETIAVPEIFARARLAVETGVASAVQPVQYQEQQGAPQTLISPLTGQIQTIAPPPLEKNFSARPFQDAAADEPLSMSDGRRSTRGQSNVDFAARDSLVDLNLRRESNPNNPNELIYTGTGGVRVTVDSPEISGMAALNNDGSRTLVILADNFVAWETNFPDGQNRMELYLEGNVVFVKGTRVIYADQMYYDTASSRGTILNADMLTPVSQYNGLVRLKAKVIEQVDENNLQAIGAAFTSSRIGVPRYWLQSETIDINRQPTTSVDENGRPQFNPETGVLETEDEYFAESRSNYLYIADRPVFFWPRFRANLNDPSIYLEQLSIGNDRVFGAQVHTAWNLHQILGIRNRPDRSKWLGIVDYLGDRGIGLGSEMDYARQSLLGLPGTAEGYYRTWFINDSGFDNLGRGRSKLTPEEERRGNILLRHRNRFAPGYSLRAELGYLSDRNFLEQYYERRWDTEKDYTTGLWLERNVGTQSFNLLADYQINEFFTQTSWLPRVDHFLLGQPILGDRAVWHGHSHAGYGRFRIATAPVDPVDLLPFDWTAWEASNATGVRAGTRQQIDIPFQLGPIKIVPYALGDVTYWQEDLTQNDLLRGYGQMGVKANLPVWRVDPTIQSTLWNVNGLAHKVNFESEVMFADASKDLSQLPLYDPLDDDAQEAFRRRFAFNTFGILPGGDVPLPYDERYFALRSGMQNWITAPSNEIADDLSIVRLGINQRWQTKRGMMGQERIVDWITLNTHVSLFPDADRDNFGSDWGMFNYDFRWHIGDRFSLVSDGFADFFSQGMRTASLGAHLGRPEVGSLFLGYRMIEGPISSNIINAAVTYRMSDRWGIRGNSSIDFGETGTIGNALSLIYIGESFLWRLGANYDATRDNLGLQFGIEPRFLSRPRMFRPGGVAVGPAGSRYLE